MLNSVDAKVIALFDRCTTAMQRRGILPLNTLIMGVELLFWSTCVLRNTG